MLPLCPMLPTFFSGFQLMLHSCVNTHPHTLSLTHTRTQRDIKASINMPMPKQKKSITHHRGNVCAHTNAHIQVTATSSHNFDQWARQLQYQTFTWCDRGWIYSCTNKYLIVIQTGWIWLSKYKQMKKENIWSQNFCCVSFCSLTGWLSWSKSTWS